MDFRIRTEQEQAGFFDTVLDTTLCAQAAAGSKRVALQVAGLRIDLIFIGQALEPLLMPALSHLVIEAPAEPGIALYLWDGRTAGITFPPPPCPRDHFTDRGDLWGFTSERYRIAFHWVEYSVNVMDLERGVGVFWVRDTAELPYWTKASPLRTLLHWCLARDGAQLLHAAAVGTADGAVLITGKGGMGKSTTALTGLMHGMHYAADDYLAVRLEPEPTVCSLYSTAKLNAQDIERFPRLREHVSNLDTMSGEEKAVMRLFPHFAPQIARSMPLRAVLTPKVVPSPQTTWVPTDALSLRRAAAFTTLSQLPYAGQGTQDFIEKMVDRLPGFEIRLGSEPAGVSQALRELLAHSDDALRASVEMTAGELGASAPLITVIMPVYNGARFIAQAVESILAQQYPSLEIIIVDDGSTDDLAAAVSKLPVDVRLFRQDNAGPAAARNRGIRDASGELIAFLDVDDLWPQGNLRTMANELQARPECMVVRGYAQMLTLDAAGRDFIPQGNPAESFPYYIGAGLYRRQAFEKVGLFDYTMRFGEDTDWYNRLRESGLPTERLPQVTLMVRRHGQNMTATLTNQEHCATALLAFKKAIDRSRGRVKADDVR